jgi:hypothetical protein
MKYYRTSDGERVSKTTLEYRMRVAKQQKLEQQFDRHGFNFCQKCERNDCRPIDISHNISVKEAKETGRAELCWALTNMEILGRDCHKKKDGLDLRFNKKK